MASLESHAHFMWLLLRIIGLGCISVQSTGHIKWQWTRADVRHLSPDVGSARGARGFDH